MRDAEIKSHLLINDRLLGSLLYFKDQQNRGHLKLSFKNKIADFGKGTNAATTLPVLPKLTEPIKLDLSYKFLDNLLEIKKLLHGNPDPEREFHKIDQPMKTCLFVLRIKDWTTLDAPKKSHFDLVLKPPHNSRSIAVVFSFLGSNGLPICPREFNTPMMTIVLPEKPLRKFCIGIAEDNVNNYQDNFVIELPIQTGP